MERNSGYYFGTEISEKWWRRYRGNGFFARGNGEYWINPDGIYFLRKLTKVPISIPFECIKDIKIGGAHAGKWVPGITVLKIIWERDGKLLSSGFRMGWNRNDTMEIKRILEKSIAG